MQISYLITPLVVTTRTMMSQKLMMIRLNLEQKLDEKFING